MSNFIYFLINNYDYKNELYPLSKKINSTIPLNIFQTWHSKTMPPKMTICVEKLKLQNPEFNYYLYDENDCRNFIKNHYSIDILNAYDKLIPGAYKADLWRLCILHKYGGIYLDIKYQCNNNFKLIELTEHEHFCLSQASTIFADNIHGIYNALLISKPNNDFLYKCILQIVENVNNKYYGLNNLYPTGPGLLGLLYPVNRDTILDDPKFDLFYCDSSKIIYNKFCILTIYEEYREEQKQYEINPHYSKLWENKLIYQS